MKCKEGAVLGTALGEVDKEKITIFSSEFHSHHPTLWNGEDLEMNFKWQKKFAIDHSCGILCQELKISKIRVE